MNFKVLICAGAIGFGVGAWAVAADLEAGKLPKDYQLYEPDFKNLEKEAKLYQEYQALGQKAKAGFKREYFLRRVSLLEDYLSRHPKDVDVHWLLANDIMRLGESYDSTKPKELKQARKTLVKAKGYGERCLKLSPNQPLCKFFLGAAMGKIGTIDGVVASLSKGEQVLNLWTDVYNSGVDYHFPDGYALQGITRYALGIFHRVVPDFFLLDWIFGFSGDIDTSVAMHKESLAFKGGKGPCGWLMLSAAMLCKTEGDKDAEMSQEAFAYLDKANKYETQSADTLICVNDAGRMKSQPTQACGYTKAKQQATDEEAVKKELDGNRS
jgi:hypothetical protein